MYIRFIFIMIFSFINLNSYSMDKYLENNNNLDLFNYDTYLLETNFSNIEKIAIDRDIANKKELGDKFLYNLTNYYIEHNKGSFNNIEEYITIGEKYLKFYPNTTSQDNIYHNIGYFILLHYSKIIESTLKEESSNLFFFVMNFSKIKKLKIRLGKSKLFIKSKKHNVKKLIDNIRYGNFLYMWERFYGKYICVPTITTESKIKTTQFKKNNIIDNQISYILNNNKKIGELIWLDSSIYKPNYLVGENVWIKYKEFLQNNNQHCRVVITGGFCNDYSNPEGLTFVNGKIINTSLLENRDALVIIIDNKLYILNLKNKYIILPETNIRINPYLYSADYSKLLDWIKEKNASTFQTQLLIHNNKLLIDLETSKKALKKRRFLLLVKNDSNQQSQIVLNIRENIDLYTITNRVTQILKNKKYVLESMINLDVGSYDIMEIYNQKGSKILNASLPLENAVNLLFFLEKD